MIIFNTSRWNETSKTRIDNKVYQIYINDDKTNYYARRITTLTDIYLNFVYSQELDYNEAYFMYRPKAFFTYFFKMNVDLIFVDSQGFVIEYFKNFSKNNVTKKIENAKFVYIFKSNTFNGLEEIDSDSFKIIHRRSKKMEKILFDKMNI